MYPKQKEATPRCKNEKKFDRNSWKLHAGQEEGAEEEGAGGGVSNLVFYAQSTVTVISVRPINHYSYISTPNQPLRLYQGEEEEEE